MLEEALDITTPQPPPQHPHHQKIDDQNGCDLITIT